MGTALPPELRAAIADLSRQAGAADLPARAARLSERYRAGGDSRSLATAADAAAYATARMPATVAAAERALAELAALRPGVIPQSLLDLGCGAGAATFAALDRFPTVGAIRLVDRNAALLAAAEALLEGSGAGRDRRVVIEQADMAEALAGSSGADLVTIAYALVEAPEAQAGEIALAAFRRAGEALVLVEPGSQAGFRRIRAARAALIGAGAVILAPCTHASACPVSEPDWCHFSVRLARSREHLRVKAATVPFEDEKFSYLVAVREGPGASGARVIRPPVAGKAGVKLALCADGAVEEAEIPARSAEFRRFRRLSWGDRV